MSKHAWICNDCHAFVRQVEALMAEVALTYQWGDEVQRGDTPRCSTCGSTNVQDNREYVVFNDSEEGTITIDYSNVERPCARIEGPYATGPRCTCGNGECREGYADVFTKTERRTSGLTPREPLRKATALK